jgi:hypothetical protein
MGTMTMRASFRFRISRSISIAFKVTNSYHFPLHKQQADLRLLRSQTKYDLSSAAVDLWTGGPSQCDAGGQPKSDPIRTHTRLSSWNIWSMWKSSQCIVWYMVGWISRIEREECGLFDFVAVWCKWKKYMPGYCSFAFTHLIHLMLLFLPYIHEFRCYAIVIGGSLWARIVKICSSYLNEWLKLKPMLNEEKGGVNRRNKPRHLLGIADEPSILWAITNDIDTLDSCYPTRLSRHGTLLSREGKIHIKSGKYSRQYGIPIDPECTCSTYQQYDRSHLWHLFKAKEPVVRTLATIHNLKYMNDLMAQQRQLILENKM